MAKRKPSTNRRHTRREDNAAGNSRHVGLFQAAGRKIDETTPGQAVENAVTQAKVKMKETRQRYKQLRRNARERVQKLQQQNLGDLAEETLEYVKQNPMRGVLVAFGIGWIMARLFRR